MSYTDNYLKLRQQRANTSQKSTGGNTLPVSSNQEKITPQIALQAALNEAKERVREQRAAEVPSALPVALPTVTHNIRDAALSGLKTGTTPLITLPMVQTTQNKTPVSAENSKQNGSSADLKARADGLTAQIEQLQKEKRSAGTALGTPLVKRQAASKEYDSRISALEKERDGLLNQFYYTENQEKQEQLKADTPMLSQYTSAQDIQADLKRIADLRSALADGQNGAKVRETQQYLAEKYGLDESVVNSWQDVNYTDVRTGRAGEGYRTLGQLYAALEQQQKQAAAVLEEGGYDYSRLAGYERKLADAQSYQQKMEQWSKTAQEQPVGSSLASVLLSPLQGADYLKTMASGIGHSDPSKPESYVPMDYYNADATNAVNAIRGAVAQKIEDNTSLEIAGQNVASFLYQTGMSVADSAVQVGTMGEWATLVMGMSSASSQAKEIIDRGGTNKQAFWGGLAAGAAEAVFEKVSIDQLLSTKSVTGWKSWLKETAKQAGTEASEETFTEIANILSDAAIMGDNSNFANAVAQYKAQGVSEEQAKRQAYLDCVKQVALAGVGGALSGAAMGGVVNAANRGVFLPGSGLDTPVTEQTPADPAGRADTGASVAAPAMDMSEQNAVPEAVEGQNKTASTGEADVSLVQRIQIAIPQMQNTASVATVNGNELPQGGRIVDRLTQFVKALGNKVNRPGFGDVLFSKGRIKNSVIGHGVGQAKIETFAAVPAVIQNGAEIDHQVNWKGRGYDTYTFAAPVTYQGQRTYLGVIVTKDTQDGRYYVHEVVDETGNIIFENKENAEATSDGRASLSGTVDTVVTSASDHTVPQTAQGVKDQDTQAGAGVFLPGSGLETDQNRTLTGGINYGEQLQRTAEGDRAANSAAEGNRIKADLSDRGQGRLSDESASGQAGVLADSPARARRRAAEQGRTAVERQNRTNALREEKVSSRQLGISSGTDAQVLAVTPESAWDDGMRSTAERIRQESGLEVTYVIGGIQIAAQDGSTRLVRGVYSQYGIVLQADNMRLSIDQIADHEIFHDKARQSPGLISQVKDRIVEQYDRSKFDRAVEAYIKNLRGLIDIPENATQFEIDDALQDIYEEIFADAYAGINAFSTHAEQFNETVEQTLEERGIGRGTQFDAATERTTGPPNSSFEKFSVASAEESDIQGAYQDADGTWHFPDGSMDIDSYTKHLEENAAKQKAERMRSKSREEFTGSPALEKLGVKVDSSVGLYERLRSLIANDKAAKLVQKEMRRAERRLQATEAERNFASGVAAGIYTEGDIPASMDADKVMELADYYWAEKSTGANLIRQQRSDINQVLGEKMATIMQKVDVGKVKLPKGFTLNHRTPTRNMTTIFGDEIGGELNAFLFDPVAANESERYRFVNRMHDEVRAFEDSNGKKKALTKEERAVVQQVIEGRAAAEMVASMEMSEAIQNAAQKIRNGQDAVDAAQEFSLGSQERKMAEQYSRWLETKGVLESGRVDSVKVENAVKKYSEMFDQFYDATNEFLVAHGYEPIGFIKGYAPHIQPTENQNLLNKAFKAMGIPADVSALPASIAGQTANYKPNKRWNPFHQHRTGDTTQYDIAVAYENYVDYMSDIFYHTDDIMRVRQASNYFRRTYAPENIRENLSWAEELRYASTEQKANFLRDNEVISRTSALSAEDINRLMDEYVDKQYENIKNTTKYSDLVVWMDDYANNLAAKQLFADRNMERTVGRTSLNVSKKLARMFARAQVAGNLSSALNQTAQLPTILSENGTKYTAMAVKDAVAGRLKKASWIQESDFLTEKAGIHYIVNTPGEMITTALFKPLEFSDSLMATLAVRSRYLKEVHAGKSHSEAMKAADAYGRSVMGSRAKGSIPLAFQQKDIVSQMLHVFQVEAANSWEHLRVDYQQDFRKIAAERGKPAAVRALAGVIVKMLLAAFLLNRVDEELYGGTPAPFDILGLFSNFVASGEGLTTNEYLKTVIDNGWEKLTGERLFDTDDSALDESFDWGTAFENAGYTVGNDIPYLRNAMGLLGWGDETLPMPDIYGAGANIASAVQDHGALSPETGKAVLSGATEFMPGGRQLSKTTQGIEAVIRGGDYSGYGDGEKLKYPLSDTPWSKTQAVLFGKYATKESNDYYASGDSALSANQTKLYQDLVKSGAGRLDSYSAIQAYREIANDDELESLEKGQRERDLICSLDLSDEQKLAFYKGMNPTAISTAEKFQALMNTGMSWKQVMDAYGKYAELKDNAELKATQQATALAQWADKNYSAKQAASIKEQFVFFSMVPAEASRYEKLVDAGLDEAAAYDLTNILTGLEPEPGKDSVSSLQKYRAVIDAGLTENEQLTALSGLMGETEYARLRVGYNYGVTPETYVSYKESLPQYDADGNGSYKQEEVRAAINALSGLSMNQKAALWQIQNKSWKPENNPYNKSVGRKVYNALSVEAEENTPQELPSAERNAPVELPSVERNALFGLPSLY